MAKKNNKQKKYKTLLSVLANGSTDEARALLIKNSGEDAKNEQDLWHKTNYLIAKFQKEMLKDKFQNDWKYLPIIKSLSALSALLHDWGKASAIFQKKLNIRQMTKFDVYFHQISLFGVIQRHLTSNLHDVINSVI